jgi:hypothetical protein
MPCSTASRGIAKEKAMKMVSPLWILSQATRDWRNWRLLAFHLFWLGFFLAVFLVAYWLRDANAESSIVQGLGNLVLFASSVACLVPIYFMSLYSTVPASAAFLILLGLSLAAQFSKAGVAFVVFVMAVVVRIDGWHRLGIRSTDP